MADAMASGPDLAVGAQDFAAIPDDLSGRHQWLVWRFESRPGDKKPRKVPYYCNGKRRTGAQGSESDRGALVDLAAAKAVLTKGKYSGVGMALLPGDGLIGIDLDGMIDGDAGEISERGENIITACASYTELSPSGKGVHIICSGDTATFKSNEVGVEVFCGRQYFTFTGRHYPGTPDTVNPLPDKVLKRLKATVDSGKKRSDGKASTAPPPELEGRAKVESALAYISPECGYDEWIHIGMAVCSELGAGAFDVWNSWSAKASKYPGRKQAEQHWKSFKPGAGVSGATLFKLAMDGGWQPPKPRREAAQAGEKKLALQSDRDTASLKKSGRQRGPANVVTPEGAITLSEDALAATFETRNEGRLAYLHKFGYWLIFNPETGIWARDYRELVFHWVREFVRGMNAEQSAKWAKAAVASSVEKYARASPGFAFIGDEFDADPWLMGTPGGVIDLRSATTIASSPTHYVSKCAAVQPADAKAPLWLEFLEQATGNDTDLIGYLQRLCGYCLTGEISEQVLVFIYGTGGNGKGIFMNTLRAVMGEYARQAPMQIFLSNNGDRHPTELANLFGARLVLASESPEGRRWDEERIKSLTGGDAISARFMNRDFFEFVPRFKLVVASNHKPRIRTVDDAWRRRLHLVPFIKKPAHPDPDLPNKLKPNTRPSCDG